MNKTPWILGGVAVALIAAGTLYAMKSTTGSASLPGAGTQVAVSSSGDERIVVPRGTAFTVTLGSELSTKTSHPGDTFEGTLASAIDVKGRVAIPAGAAIAGHVAVAEQPGRASGRGKLQLMYDQVTFGGHAYDLGTQSEMYQGASGTKKDVELIGGGAVAGGVVGAVLGKGVVKGAVVGAAAGTGASLLTRGPQLNLPRGTVLNATLDQALSVRRS